MLPRCELKKKAEMSRTPRRGCGFQPRSDRQRRVLLTAGEVADMTGREACRTGFQRREGYGPHDDLYSGEYRNFSDDLGDERSNDENMLTPLTGSSRYNSAVGMQDNGLQQPPRNRPPRVRSADYDANLTAILQEQQHILHQVLDTQKKMQKKQEEFEAKLNEFARRS